MRILCILITFFSISICYAQHYPGGVVGAEVWYQANWDYLGENIYPNSAQDHPRIERCSEDYEKNLFNFNYSASWNGLCLRYNLPLENTTGQNVFFVGEPESVEKPFSHLGTIWREDLTDVAETDSIVRNFFNHNMTNIYARDILATYNSSNNAHVNFYHTNHYNIDKKFKSFGKEGETAFYIGWTTDVDPDVNFEDEKFYGNFPEFIAFSRELSDNERQRIESYLGLKYGLTLSTRKSYINSKNIIFWDNSNNELFPNRIFGFGKDDISGLNQLQSESTHLKKHLVAAIEGMAEHNPEKQEQIEIPNNHYLVFGDNGRKPALERDNSKGIKFWDKVWLAQRTGESTHKFPIDFKLYLTDELIDALSSDENLKLWLLQDKHIGNDEVSDFDGNQIQYYEAGDVNFDEGLAYFKEIQFDDDFSIYDQYTFGVGPEMIIQASFIGCRKDELKLNLEIFGGNLYDIVVTSEAGNFEIYDTGLTLHTFPAEAGITYTIYVQDESQGLEAEIEITPEPWDMSVDLGPDQYLSSTITSITLNAGGAIPDPNANYQWYHNGNLLPHTGSTLMVTEIGSYEVVVTSEDQSCSVSDVINIFLKDLDANITTLSACTEFYNSIIIEPINGVPTFTTTLESVNGTTSYAHNGTTTISDLPYGDYNISITDSNGNVWVWEDIATLTQPLVGLGVDIYAQLEALCEGGPYEDPNFPCVDYGYEWGTGAAPYFNYHASTIGSFSLNASIGVEMEGITYQWYENGIPINISGPVISFTNDNLDCHDWTDPNSAGGNPVYTVVASNPGINCSTTQSFVVKGACAIQSTPMPTPPPNGNGEIVQNDVIEGIVIETQESNALQIKVYPNPTKNGESFEYEVSSPEKFDGSVTIFTISGVKLQSVELNGQSDYHLSFDLQVPGMYLIHTMTSLGTVSTERIVIN